MTLAILCRGWVTRADIMLRQRRDYAAAKARLCCGKGEIMLRQRLPRSRLAAGPETPVGWELEQVHAAQRAEQSMKHKPFKLQSAQVLPSAGGPMPRGAG